MREGDWELLGAGRCSSERPGAADLTDTEEKRGSAWEPTVGQRLEGVGVKVGLIVLVNIGNFTTLLR